MEKPITLLQEELKNNLVNSINESNLHPAIILPIVKEIYEECVNYYNRQAEAEKRQYQESLSASAETETTEETKTE